MTYLTSGIVMELSAMFVAMMTFLRPYCACLKALSYSSSLRDECRGMKSRVSKILFEQSSFW